MCIFPSFAQFELDQMFTRSRVRGEEQPYVKGGEISFRLEEEVEYLVRPSSGYPY